MRANKLFRQRITPQPADLAAAQQAVEPVRAALATVPGPVTPQSVTQVLLAAGYPSALATGGVTQEGSCLPEVGGH